MGNSGNVSPEFTIKNRRSTSIMAHSSSRSPDEVAQKDSNDLAPIDPNQLPPDFPAMPVSPVPTTPDPPFSDPKTDLAKIISLSEDTPAPAFCRERHTSSSSESTSGPERISASKEGSNEQC